MGFKRKIVSEEEDLEQEIPKIKKELSKGRPSKKNLERQYEEQEQDDYEEEDDDESDQEEELDVSETELLLRNLDERITNLEAALLRIINKLRSI